MDLAGERLSLDNYFKINLDITQSCHVASEDAKYFRMDYFLYDFGNEDPLLKHVSYVGE